MESLVHNFVQNENQAHHSIDSKELKEESKTQGSNQRNKTEGND
jgi:hypothetical protein